MINIPGQISLFDICQQTKQDHPPEKRNCAATNKECNHKECKEVAIKCLGINCEAECCQACTLDCGARCNYSAHQPKVLKEKTDIKNQTWVRNPNYKCPFEEEKTCDNAENCKEFKEVYG